MGSSPSGGESDPRSEPGSAADAERSLSRSLASPLLWPLVVGAALVVLASSLVFHTSAMLTPAGAVGTMTVFVVLAVVLVLQAPAGETDAGTEDRVGDSADGPRSEPDPDADDSDVWNAIPSGQYERRHAEPGGLSRSEQETTLRDVQERADDLESVDDPPRN
ncbi:hypothetical protein [Halobiforma nitratireducens]|uniref:Uncharacterized protein n=1 Tax=Halobiforma nitratireducens JCM 10879 TaxID=1227454 RepID=M0M1F9_9EURY|nr:hypothetical protein [Halobiforma nitratireducens]EMA38235.1 hypothetical protein C446_10310 [Halobiforma nitratireducens JCM 10879]